MIELEDAPVLVEPDSVPVTEAAPGEKFVSFELGEELYCVAAASVQEVVHPVAPAAVPRSPSWLLGLAVYRGESVALIDPRVVAGAYSPAPGGKAKIVVFRFLPNHTQFALPIDSLREMITADPASLRAGEIIHEGRPATLIDHEQLFASLEQNLS